MRRPALHRSIVSMSVLMLLSPAILAAASETDLGNVLDSMQSSRRLQRAQAAAGPLETEARGGGDALSSEEFVLGVRHRSMHEQASGSNAVQAQAAPGAPQTPVGQTDEPDYSIEEWWRSSSQTTKTCTIVGAAVVFLIIFL